MSHAHCRIDFYFLSVYTLYIHQMRIGMTTKIQKWGNSLAVRLPREITKKLTLVEGGAVDLIAKNDVIVFKPVKIKRKKVSLEDLVKQITPKNLHKEIGKFGKIMGFTKIFAAPQGFEHQIPYYAGIIKFADGTAKPLEIIGNENSVKIGAKVKTVIRRIGLAEPEELIRYGIKAKLLKINFFPFYLFL